MPPARPARVELAALGAVSAALLAVRLYAAGRIGFGDAEALYASYALHAQPAYLDHPGLVGAVARAIGGGTSPDPARAHAVTAAAATFVPWAMAGACRACGASWPRAWAAAIVVALTPEAAIGLFGMTPDLLLALAWIGAMGLAAVGLRSAPGCARAALAFGCAGVLAGAAAASKATGVVLLLALATAYGAPAARPHARTIAPWAGLAAGALVLLPIVSFEATRGWPMLHHRLVDTQVSAGVSLRNAGALVGGQLAYLSPLTAWLAARTGRDLWRGRGDAVGSLLAACCFVPLAALVPLCLWSRVAEPHWIAPALLALAPAGARAPAAPPRRLVVASSAIGGALVAAVHAWVLVPSLVRLAPASTYDPRVDIANELYGWPDVASAVREEAVAAWTPGARRGDLVVVGPHWVICAQLEAALRGEVPVGCDTPVPDDFDDWWPRARWREADTIVWVSDGRFAAAPAPAPLATDYATLRVRDVRIERGGRVVRAFTITVFTRRATAEAPPAFTPPTRPEPPPA
jgi:hypothetical protein